MNEERILELLNLLVNDMIEGEGHHIHNVIQNLLDLGFTRKELLALSFQEADISDACPQNTRIDYLYRDASNYKNGNNSLLKRTAAYTATISSSSRMVLIFPSLHHSGRFAFTSASANGGGTAFPQRATCLLFP